MAKKQAAALPFLNAELITVVRQEITVTLLNVDS
jgi:hypothetical protein